MNTKVIQIFTDGSCHTQHKIGAWATIILVGKDKTVIKGEVQDTTHNRMELLAVINAIDFAKAKYDPASFEVYTDSQYVMRIRERMAKLTTNNFITKKGNELQNADLLKLLIHQIETLAIEFKKVKAHQRQTDATNDPVNFNIEVDILVRQTLRKAVPVLTTR
jgi:ribonuclease HI